MKGIDASQIYLYKSPSIFQPMGFVSLRKSLLISSDNPNIKSAGAKNKNLEEKKLPEMSFDG
jgi:hypothetical protein